MLPWFERIERNGLLLVVVLGCMYMCMYREGGGDGWSGVGGGGDSKAGRKSGVSWSLEVVVRENEWDEDEN